MSTHGQPSPTGITSALLADNSFATLGKEPQSPPNMLLLYRATGPLLLLLHLGSRVLGGLDGHCPPLGPVLPPPRSPSTSPAVQNAVTSFANYFTALTAPFQGSAVSVSVASIHEPGRKLVDLHHTPPLRQAGSTSAVDGDTVYRIASISKLFTTLGVLLAGVRMDDSITDYLPDLRLLQADDGFSVNWNDVTVGSLASRKLSLGRRSFEILGRTKAGAFRYRFLVHTGG